MYEGYPYYVPKKSRQNFEVEKKSVGVKGGKVAVRRQGSTTIRGGMCMSWFSMTCSPRVLVHSVSDKMRILVPHPLKLG